MTANLTANKTEDRETAEEMKSMAKSFSDYRKKFISDIDNDAEAFEKVLASLNLPASSDDEHLARDAKIQESYKNAVEVPLRISKDIFEMMGIIKHQLEKVNDIYITDTAQAHMLAETALRSLIYHIKSNLISISDKDFIENAIHTIDGFKLGRK